MLSDWLSDCFQRRKQAALFTMFLMIFLIVTCPAFGQRGQSCTILVTPRPMPNGTSLPLATTPDGRYTLFSSTANNLVPGDTNGQTDLFLYDILKDVYSRVSVGNGGSQAIGGISQQGKMDALARYICFSSRANNLVPGDTNGREDVFLHDRQTGNTICLSTRAGTNIPNGGVNPTMSLGGRYAGLSLNRTNPAGRPYSAYIYDIVEQTYLLVSKDSAGNPANGESYMRDISENGRFVLFASNATNLDPRATDGRFYLYLHDRDSDDDGVFDSGETRTMLASLEGDGDPETTSTVGWPAEELAQGMLGGNWHVLFSPESSLLHLYDVMRNETVMMETAWNSNFSGLTSVSNDARQLVYPKMMPGGHVQLLWRDLETGETRIASVTSIGQEANVAMTGNAGLGQRLLSNGGQCVTFSALDSVDVAWVPGDLNGASDVFRRNFHHDTTTGVSVTIGKRPNSAAGSPSINYDGSVIAFISDADDLVAGDLNEKADVFLKMGGLTLRIMAYNGAEPNGHSETPIVSGNGHFVAFVSEADNMTAGSDNNNFKDVFLYEMANNSLMRISNGMGGAPANGESVQPSISRDGNLVVFTSVASNLVPNDTNDASDVFLYNRITGTLIRIQGAAGQPNGSSADPVISADGQYIAFVSEASNLVPGDTNNRDDVFVYEVATGQMTIIRAHNGALANRNAFTVDINEDGRYVAFCSNSTNLVPNDTNGRRDIFVWDRLTGQLELVSVDPYGRQGNRDSIDPSISADGRYVAFLSESSNFMPGDRDIDYGPLGGEGSLAYDVDVFVVDRDRHWIWYNHDGRGQPGNRPSQSPKISGDGQLLAYVTHASNLECSRTEPRDMGDILLHQGPRCIPPGDVDGDGQVDDRDLLAVLFDFGSEDSPADIVADGTVDDADLLAVLFNYGTSCGAAARGDRNDRDDQQLYFGSLQEPGKEESDSTSGENEGDVYVIRTAEPFDRAEWNRQTRELDMAHEGRWPYPVAGYGSEPWVNLYGDPLLWKDNGSQFGNNLFGGNPSGGDFFPQAASYTYSNSKTVSLGNSNVNIYVMGKLYIYATCYYGGYFKAEAQGEAGIKLWSLNPKLVEAYGLAEAANNNFKLNAYLKVVGQTLWSTTLNQGLSYTKQGTIGPWAKNQSTSWTVWLGIVPIKVTVGFNASIGANYYFFAGLAPVKAHARFQPFVTSSAYIQAGLAWSLGCSASAGVGGSINLLNDTLTAEAMGHVFVFDENCCAQVTLKIHNQMNALSGSFYLYANACCWGLNGSKCGWLRRSQSWQHTLTSWPGYSASGDLFFAQYTYCF